MKIRTSVGMAGWVLALVVLLAGCTGGDDGEENPAPIAPTATAATTAPTTSTGVPSSPSSTTATATATTASSASTGDPFDLALGDMTFDEVLAAYKASIDDYTWPPAYVPDADAVFAMAGPEFFNGSYQPGFELSMLTPTNACAWNLAWLDARQHGDKQMEAEALDVMTTIIPELPRNIDDPGTMEHIYKRAEQAALGDPTLVTQFVDAACRYPAVIWKEAPEG